MCIESIFEHAFCLHFRANKTNFPNAFAAPPSGAPIADSTSLKPYGGDSRQLSWTKFVKATNAYNAYGNLWPIYESGFSIKVNSSIVQALLVRMCSEANRVWGIPKNPQTRDSDSAKCGITLG
jgi:hypothetical protein